MAKLTPKQELFIQEYLVDLNATQAAIRAGYSKKTASVIGAENLVKPKIAAAIQEAKQERQERINFDADKILVMLSEMAEADIGDILDDDDSLLPVKQWPKIWRQMLTGMDIRKEFEGSGQDRDHIADVIKIKFLDRMKNLELLGRHTTVQAWKDQVELDIPSVIIKDMAGGKYADD